MSEVQFIQPQEAIADINQQFMAAFSEGNARGVAGLYTAGAQLFPVNAGPIAGLENIQRLRLVF